MSIESVALSVYKSLTPTQRACTTVENVQDVLDVVIQKLEALRNEFATARNVPAWQAGYYEQMWAQEGAMNTAIALFKE